MDIQSALYRSTNIVSASVGYEKKNQKSRSTEMKNSQSDGIWCQHFLVQVKKTKNKQETVLNLYELSPITQKCKIKNIYKLK